MPKASPKSSNMIRRFSNRAHRCASKRQQSSAAPASRNGSIGPSILRRQSDSNATAPPRPPEFNAMTDTDEEAGPVPDGNISLLGLDGTTHSSSNNSTAGSINGSASAKAGPLLPAELRTGCEVLKVSSRSCTRRVNLVYETESNKLSWDPARPHKSLHVDEIKEIRTEPQNYTLDRPMNEYIISSSHNTYLLGRQVAGQSSVEGYISVLVRGCRCVEVDCWDGNSGQPQVNHGRTLITSISFREVMTTINKYAFVKSRFPLWISLEVHCSPNQQAIMILEDSYDKLPSPSELMERILIKVKKPQIKQEPPASDFWGRRRGNSLNSSLNRPVADGAMLLPSQSLPQSPTLSLSPSSRRLVSKTRVNIITEGGAVNFAGFDAAEAKQYNHIFSFMESRFAKYFRAKEQKMAVDLHNLRYMMRVYPDRTRITSNNFDPLLYWRRGI
ncbi:hypothetical protein ACJ41O_014434 [Fusarium nematophilum]